MSLSGYLSEYSLAEIFYFAQEGNKTGLLSIEPAAANEVYRISFQGGRLMSVVNSKLSERETLLATIEQRGWLTTSQVLRLKGNTSSLREPLGNYLKSHSLLNTEQLILIFNSQVVANICKLFVEVHQGRFKFDPKAPIAYSEMTGLSLTAKEATLMGLRLLRDWSDLTAKLPAADSALQRLSTIPIGVRLDRQESQVWDLAVGEMSITSIARNLGLEVSRVQQIGFRLSVIGLITEVPTEPSQPVVNRLIEAPKPIAVANSKAPTAVSTSFLSNLMGFLRSKG